MSDDETFTGMYELLDAIEAVIKASDPASARRWQALLMLSLRIVRKISFGPSGQRHRSKYPGYLLMPGGLEARESLGTTLHNRKRLLSRSSC